MVRGRLWRASDPGLPRARREALVRELGSARNAVRRRRAGGAGLEEARKRVDAAKVGLGERGPAWWTDGAPDDNRRLARNTPYADWFSTLPDRP